MENHLFNKRIALLSLGCKVNSYETECIKQDFISYGCQIVDFKDKADVYVVNTCTVTNIADHKSRQMLRRVKTANPESIVVATGCYVQNDYSLIVSEKIVDVVVGNRNKALLASDVNNYIAGNRSEAFIRVNDDLNDYEINRPMSEYNRSRVDIKIQDGCNQFCTYCIIPYVRGRISSRRENDIVGEVKSLAERGFKEIILTGIHISSYGFDELSKDEQLSLKTNNGRMPLLDLIEKLNDIEGIERIRLGSLEPRIITDDFVRRLITYKKVCPHFHLSLQSGCDSVLKRMNRRYDTKMYREGVEILRTYYYKPSITTDIIVGFPGETEDEYLTTEEFCKNIKFSAVHIFPYSKREGTVAAKMEGHLSNNIKGDRASRLSKIEEINRTNYEMSFADSFSSVFIEELLYEYDCCYGLGFTPEYVPIKAKIVGDGESYIGNIYDIKITSNRDNKRMIAELF